MIKCCALIGYPARKSWAIFLVITRFVALYKSIDLLATIIVLPKYCLISKWDELKQTKQNGIDVCSHRNIQPERKNFNLAIL